MQTQAKNPYKKLVPCLDQNGRVIPNFKWNAGSKAIIYVEMVEGARFEFSTRITSESEKIDEATFTKAKKKASVKKANIIRKDEQARLITPLLGDEIKAVIQKYENRPRHKTGKDHTLNTVKSSYAKIIEWWADRYVHELNVSNWEVFQKWLDEKYPGFNTFNITKYMRVLASHCFNQGLIKIKPKIVDKNAQLLKVKRKKKKNWVYTDDEVIALDEACETAKEHLAIRLGYQMAFRISDVVSLSWDRINLTAKTPYVKFEGEDKEENFDKYPLSDDILDVLRIMPRESDWLFPQVLKDQPIKTSQFDFKAIRTRAKVKRGTFHSLRRYRLTNDFNNPEYTTTQVCKVRRVSLKEAYDSYITITEKDLMALKNSGSLSKIRGKNA